MMSVFLSTRNVQSLGDITPPMVRRTGNISGAIALELERLVAKNVGTGYRRQTTLTVTKKANSIESCV